MKRKNESGSIALEASIVLTLFIFFIVAIYSFFAVFEARGKISSNLLQTAQSLSLDPYATDKIYVDFDDKDNDSLLTFLTSFGLKSTVSDDRFVTTDEEWYAAGNAKDNKELEKAIKNRFVAYLTSDGSEDEAEALLRKYKITDGIDGLDFEESTVDSDGLLTITLKYKLKYLFDVPTINLPPLEFKQSVAVQLWKKKSANYDSIKATEPTNATSAPGSSGGGFGRGGGRSG